MNFQISDTDSTGNESSLPHAAGESLAEIGGSMNPVSSPADGASQEQHPNENFGLGGGHLNHIPNRESGGGNPGQNEERKERTAIHEGSSISSNSFFRNGKPFFEDRYLYGPVGRIVEAISPRTEASSVAIYAHLLVGLGNIIGSLPHFQADGQDHGTNLYSVIVGPTAALGRKGTARANAARILVKVDEAWHRQRVKSGIVSGSGIVQAFTDDSDARLLLEETEFSKVLQALGQHHVSETLRQGWDGGKLEVLRRKDPISVPHAHLSFVGHITPEELRGCLRSVEISNGTANRILWVYTGRSKILPDESEWPDLTALIERLQNAVSSARERELLHRSAAAQQLWRGMYEDLSTPPEGRLGKILGRAEAQVMRLALLFALLDEANHIDVQHLDAAMVFWRYCEASARHIFGEMFTNPKTQRIWEALDKGPMTRSEISALFSNNASKEQIDAALDELGDLIAIGHESGSKRTTYRRRDLAGQQSNATSVTPNTNEESSLNGAEAPLKLDHQLVS